ncbi:MAG: HAAS signaling domain-containing protein [Clostridium fessum]
MRKTEFLQELREALDGEVSASVIQSNISYYDQYISQEAAKGRREEEVIEEIGSPRLIAKTIIDSSEGAGETEPGRFVHFGRRCRERAHSVLLQRRFFGAGRQRSAAELPLH